jgi:hypothetical protein
MHTKINKILLTAFCILLAYSATATAADKTISLSSESGLNTIDVVEGHTFTVQITVDNASAIAGASFTITYDTANLTLDNVNSSFFQTFNAQLITTTESDATGGYITIDYVRYYSPQVVATTTNGSMLAAARFDNGSGTDAGLFTLTFTATGSLGVYPISVSQSVITNVDAGYTANPDDIDNFIPFFVGIDGETYTTHNVSTINAVAVTMIAEFVDSDSDGIDDNWEITYLPNGVDEDDTDVLDYFTTTGDYDRDGYSDYQEYLNQNETDPNRPAYIPTIKDASGGTGWTLSAGAKIVPIITTLLNDE